VTRVEPVERLDGRLAAPSSAATWTGLGIVYVVWGSTYLGIAVMNETIPPLVGSAYRFLLASTSLAVFLALRLGPGGLRVTRRQLAGAALVGLLLIGVGNGGVAFAETHIPSGLTALLVAAMPLWVVVLRTATGERPARSTLLGVAIGFVGIAVLVLPGGWTRGPQLLGVLAVLAATMCWATGSFLSPRLGLPSNPFVLAVYEMGFGSVVLFIAGLAHGETLSLAGWSGRSSLAWFYLVTIGSLVAFSTFAWLTARVPLSLVATYAYVNPVVAVLLGWLIKGDAVTRWTLIGGSIVVSGVIAVIRGERSGSSAPSRVVRDYGRQDARNP
jgi:drug/metabolite transporter (DMT)-like permease